jgi:hypothetical protein
MGEFLQWQDDFDQLFAVVAIDLNPMLVEKDC